MPTKEHGENDQAIRPSTIVDRRTLPRVQEREDLNRLLRVHDPQVSAANKAEITAKHAPILRQIAQEGPNAGGEPGVRKQAIAWLGRFAAPDDLNVLVKLAQFDPDPGIRGAALLSLGASGVQMAAPILAVALASSDTVEAVTAAKALNSLADRIGADPPLALISWVRGTGLSKLAKKALEAREVVVVPEGRKHSSTHAD